MTIEQNRPWPDDETIGRWESREDEPRGGARYPELVAAHRLVQDRLAGAVMPADVVDDVIERLNELSQTLTPYQAAEDQRWDGWRPDIPGRGHLFLPPFVVDDENDSRMRGRVTFTRLHLGGNGAAHGGAIPLLFDDILGKVVNFHHAEGVARTAYLNVNYRSIAPLDQELHFDATLDRVEGRKRWGSARLFTAEHILVADGEGLFVKLRPGQP